MNKKLKQEVINLLPWYHLGKLTDEEKKQVEDALSKDRTLKEIASAEQEMMTKVRAEKTLMDGSIFNGSADRLENVLAKIDQLEAASPVAETTQKTPVASKVSTTRRVLNYLNSLLSGNSRSFTYAVFAALTVVQLSLLVLFIMPSGNMGQGERTSFETASYNEQQEQKNIPVRKNHTILIVSVGDLFEAKGFNEILGSDAEAVLLPPDDGYYRVRINKPLTKREIEVLSNELSKKDGEILVIGEESP